MKLNINHYLNAGLAVIVGYAFIQVMLGLFEREVGLIGHLLNVWVFTSIYSLISFNTDIDD